MMGKAKPNVVFLQEVKSISFELLCWISYYWRGPYWDLDLFQGSYRVVLSLFLFL